MYRYAMTDTVSALLAVIWLGLVIMVVALAGAVCVVKRPAARIELDPYIRCIQHHSGTDCARILVTPEAGR